MPTGDFEKTSWGWQIEQFQRQVGEWVELQFSHLKLNRYVPGTTALWLGKLIEVAFWLVVSLVLIRLCWQLWRQFSPVFWSQAEVTETTTTLSESTVAEWLQRSQTYFRQGNYREACRYLYLAMLQRLNDTGIIRHQPSRTDGEYLQLVRQLHQSQPYQTLITTHEQLCFGDAEVLLETFNQCQQAYQEILAE